MTSPVLETRGITKSFGALKASQAISIDLQQGEIHALIGPNGAGKSTLIKQIAGSLAPDAGQVFLDGENVTALPVPVRARRGLGRTFQISALAMEDTVLQNVLLGAIGAQSSPYHFFRRALAPSGLRDIAEAALERVGLSNVAKMRTSELSHGQRRQLEVAVALTLKPKAFVMDEPMAGLGGEGSKRMTNFLDGLRAEAPILLVEHDMDAVFALADRVSVLVYGELIATGTVAEVRADPAVRSAYLGEDA
jgi:branched-chain amino acid transport system ATP-binding protein